MDNPSTSANWHLGTIGFGYEDWRGGFYPAKIRSSGYLAHYSRIFNAVEIDSTFHAIPKADYLRRWAETTPSDFRFALKMPQQITHQPNINHHALTLGTFLQAARVLGEKTGPILIQLPPSFRIDRIDELRDFLAGLPGDLRYAVEVRHPSWYIRKPGKDPDLSDLLREFGICWAATEFPGLPGEIFRTANYGFIRWIGKNGSFARHTHLQLDRSNQLKRWKSLIEENQRWLSEIYGFFNNDYAGFAPGVANQFKQMMGLPVETIRAPDQGRLF